MSELLCFDICAIAILITLFYSLKSKGIAANKAGRRLSVLVDVAIISALLDIVINLFNIGKVNYMVVGYILMGIYNTLHNSMLYIFTSYIVVLIGTWHKVGNPLVKSIRLVPCYITAICSVMAPMAKLFYGYDEFGNYVRYPLFSIFLVLDGIYIAFTLYFVIKNIKIIGKRKASAMSICVVAYIIECYIQFRYPYLVVSTLGFTLSLMVIVMFVDNPEDKAEDASGLMGYNAYINDLEINFLTMKPFDIVHINIRNNKIIEEMLSHEKYSAIIKRLSAKLSELNSRFKLDAGLYHIGDGRFRVVSDDNNFDVMNEFAKETVLIFNKEITDEDFNVITSSSVNITQCPADFDNLEDLLSFRFTADKFENIGKITTSKEIIEKDSFSIGNNIDKLIEKAIVNNSLRVFYQPIYDVRHGGFPYVDATVKIVDKDLGIIEPEVFMETAERNGSISEIEIHGIEEICRLIVSEEFEDTGIKMMGINISAVQFLQKNFAERILEITKKFKVDPSRMFFEITESVAVDNQKLFANNLVKLAHSGFTFALNNYGTGYANIINLASMPIEVVIFDKSLTDTRNNEKLQVILENSIDMIKALNKRIIIVGVDNKLKMNKFASLDCEYLQGEYFTKPVDAAGLFTFLSSEKEKNAVR